MFSIISSVFDEHHADVEKCIKLIKESTNPFLCKLAQHYLYTLASKSGNDTLEKVFVESTGRKVKKTAQKHGADSEDNTLEAKPLKGAYGAHISDDTPSSLMKHQTIPFIILGCASPNGQKILWVVQCSYRIFDTARFKALVKQLPESERKKYESFPVDLTERYKVLTQLKKAFGKKNGIRSNPLPFSCISALKPGEYCVWVNPTSSSSEVNKDILRLQKEEIPIDEKWYEDAMKYKTEFQHQIDTNLSEMNITKLKELCKKQNIKGYTNKKKEDLLKFLNASESRTSLPQTFV